MIAVKDADFSLSGLKADSVARISRLAVVDTAILCGAIGEISVGRLARIKKNLADWIAQKQR